MPFSATFCTSWCFTWTRAHQTGETHIYSCWTTAPSTRAKSSTAFSHYCGSPTVFTAPASYSCLPVEAAFGWVKNRMDERQPDHDNFEADAARHGTQLSRTEKDIRQILLILKEINPVQVRRLFAAKFLKMQEFIDLKQI